LESSNWNQIVTREHAIEYLIHNAPFLIRYVNDDLLKPETKSSVQHILAKLNQSEPYRPNFIDLARLHCLILETRRTSGLEFGTGFSTIAIADALQQLDTEPNRKFLLQARKPEHSLLLL